MNYMQNFLFMPHIISKAGLSEEMSHGYWSDFLQLETVPLDKG